MPSPASKISDPALATDEQNNIEVYKAIAPGVVNIHSTSYMRDFFGMVEPAEGSGSGSVIDAQGNILTNYHVIERAEKLTVSFGGDRNYPATVIGGEADPDSAAVYVSTTPQRGIGRLPPVRSPHVSHPQQHVPVCEAFFLELILTTSLNTGL